MPSYLKDALHVPDKTVSAWLSISLFVGLLGLPLGGLLSDWSQQRFGPRKGRIYVVATFLTLAGLVFIIPLVSRNPVHVVFAIGAVEFFTLCTTAAIWAIGQQIGGPHTASTMAWGNAWGNLGAAILPLIVPWFKDAATGDIAWPVIFGLCLGAYLISAVAAALVRQDRPLLPGA